MDTIWIPTEEEFRRWVREEVTGCLNKIIIPPAVPSMNDEPMLSREEAAKMFNISIGTLNNWRARGLTHYRDKRKVCYLRSDILEYLKRTKKKSTF